MVFVSGMSYRGYRGWVLKQGLIIKTWRKRYCVVTPASQELVYYENEPSSPADESRPRGRISLAGAVVTSESTPNKIGGLSVFVFSLQTKATKFLIAVLHEQERKEWIQSIFLTAEVHKVAEARSDDGSDMIGRVSLAAGEMMGKFESVEEEFRGKLSEIVNDKWVLKEKLDKENKANVDAILKELSGESAILEEEECNIQKELGLINRSVAEVDLFVKRSLRLQHDFTQKLSKQKTAGRVMLAGIQKNLEVGEEPCRLFVSLARSCFAGIEKPEFDLNRIKMLDVFVFMEKYYRSVHLPKKEGMEKLKADRFWIWKNLVRVVNKRKSTQRQIRELRLISNFINSVLNSRSRPDLIDLPEDTPEIYKQEWEDVCSQASELMKLRSEQEKVQEELASTLHNREFLRDWASGDGSMSPERIPRASEQKS